MIQTLDVWTIRGVCVLTGAALGAATAPPSASWWATWGLGVLCVLGRVLWLFKKEPS